MFWETTMPAAESNGVRLHYELSGNPHGPVLVLANSLGSSMHMWDKVLSTLEKRNQILRFDMRGHGKSQIVGDYFTIEDLGRDVLRLLDEVQVERASICGLSLGGVVGLWLGVNAADRIDRLIFANTAARIGNQAMWEQRMEASRSERMSSLAAATLGRWFTPAFRSQHPDEMETIRAMIAATDPAGYSACCAVLRDTDLRSDASKVEAPSLVITGTHDPATPPEDGRALNASLRNSRYVELDASHLSAWESADEFAGAVVQHLAAGEKANE
jgi:3-oxoadipate enol-lactonase